MSLASFFTFNITNNIFTILRAGGNRFALEGMDGWRKSMEDALSWILEAEEHLLSVHNLGHRYKKDGCLFRK